MHGYTPGRFAFNVKGGRCEAWEGDGVKRVEMHFRPDVYVPCEVCHGRRFNEATLAVKYNSLSVADVLDLTVDEALQLFKNHPILRRSLETLADVGLGYIALGQSSSGSTASTCRGLRRWSPAGSAACRRPTVPSGTTSADCTHGFDDQGSKFDADGNLANWWTPEDRRAFEERTDCFVKEYDGFVPVKDAANGDVHLNGRLTLGENTADNGGLRVSYMALQKALAGQPRRKVDGFTPEQRLFLGFANVWCQNVTEAAARQLAQTDTHSAGEFSE